MTMKKILFLSSLAIAAAFTVSCNKENIEGDAATAGESALFPASSVINASSASTKTTLDGTSILWAEGDAITLFGENGAPVEYTLVSGAGTKSGQFENQDAAGQVTAYAVYPATENTLAESKVAVTVAAAQNYTADGFPTDYPMAAVTENGTDFTFENLATVLRLQLKGDATVASVTVRTLGENEYIAGAAAIDFTSGTPVLAASAEGAASAVTLDCGDGVALSAENETVFNFILIPGEYSGFEVTVTDANGHETVRTTGALELLAGTVKGFEAALDIYSTPQGWNITGSFNDMNWGGDWIDMKNNGRGLYYIKGLDIPADGKFKVRYSQSEWYGSESGAISTNVGVYLGMEFNSDENNISVQAGTYDIYFDQMPHYIFVMEQGKTPGFGLVGSINGNAWNIEKPVAMTMENDGYFVAKGVNPDQENAIFKIVVDGSYNNAYNIGCDTPLEIGQPVTGTKGTSNNFTIPNATTEVTYDIWFDLGTLQVLVMPEGQVPGQSAE